MFILVTGGAASGKSEQAERLLCMRTANNSRLYLATMQPFGVAAQQRIQRHHILRAQKGFQTIERYTQISKLKLDTFFDGILVECMSNLLANEMFQPDGAGIEAVQEIVFAVDNLTRQCNTLVVVTNEIFSDDITYAKETEQYLQNLAQINCALAQKADVVIQVVCGICVPLKGETLL